MGDWFEILPQARCDVEATTSGAIAFYFPPANDGSPRRHVLHEHRPTRSGWGRFELEAMAYHEGIPGHHLQLAIAAELNDVPEFRKHASSPAYAEGWGLYTERLADEMGLYSSPLDRMGMLAADSMRACRLVVDTGLHALGWSRQQAIDYMVANSPMSEGTSRAEIDRYIVHARPGAVVHDRPAGDPADPGARPSGARATASTSRRSTTPCWAPARCRSRRWTGTWVTG